MGLLFGIFVCMGRARPWSDGEATYSSGRPLTVKESAAPGAGTGL